MPVATFSNGRARLLILFRQALPIAEFSDIRLPRSPMKSGIGVTRGCGTSLLNGVAIMSRPSAKETSDRAKLANTASSPLTSEWRETASGQRLRIDSVPRPRRWLELPGHLSATELKRRLWHMSPGLLPIASYIYPHKDPLSPTFQKIAAGLIVGIAALLLWRYKTIRRKGEQSELAAVFGYSVPVLATLLLLPKHAELGMLVLCVLAFGDGMATTCGLLLRGPTLPWNRAKSWIGSLAFVGFGGYLASLAYWAESQPRASWPISLTCGFSAAVVAAFAESLPSRVNDNVRVGIASAVTAVATHALVVGL